MQSINGSYFDKSLSIDGIYIGFGAVNDLFCNDLLQTEGGGIPGCHFF